MRPGFDSFDRRGYRTVSVREGYRDWAPTYEQAVLDRMDLGLLEALQSVAWGEVARAADLGCGTGRTGAWLKRQRVGVVDGVDLVPEMLAAAQRRGAHDDLRLGDLRATGLAAGAYDLVTCSLVDEHLAELAPLYREAARLLRRGGAFVLVGYHPFFIMRAGMPTHFDHPAGEPVAIETHLHLFGDHVGAAAAAGCALVEMREAVVDEEWLRHKPRWQEYRGWPISFACVWRSG